MQSEPSPDASSIAKLKLPDGSLVMPDGSIIKPQQALQPAVTVGREIQSGRRAARTLEKMHRKLGDLPDIDTKKMNAIAAIIMYSGIGLSDSDIAVCLGCDVEHVHSIKELDVYRQLAEMFDTQVFTDAKRTASHILAKAADRAADTMVGALESPNEMIAVGAAKEVLRMNGITTEQASGADNKSGLNIKIIRKGEKRDETITVEI